MDIIFLVIFLGVLFFVVIINTIALYLTDTDKEPTNEAPKYKQNDWI